MEPIPCSSCDSFFVPRNKLQTFCSDPDCQRARKALWQKQKIACDPEYKKGQRLAQNKWLQNNPNYWKNYRRRNPDKAERNRSLQKIRNCRNKDCTAPKVLGIAKMDARKSTPHGLLGLYWLVPAVAKMDPVKIFITTAPVLSP